MLSYFSAVDQMKSFLPVKVVMLFLSTLSAYSAKYVRWFYLNVNLLSFLWKLNTNLEHHLDADV